MTVKVALVYPFSHPAKDNSIFRFPPLGLGYLAAALKTHGFEVELVDCTFMQFLQAVEQSGSFQSPDCWFLLDVFDEENDVGDGNGDQIAIRK